MTPTGRRLLCRVGRQVGLLALAIVAGCHKPLATDGTDVAGGQGVAEDAGAEPRPAPPLVGPSRCRATAWGARIAGDAGTPDLDLGDAVPFGDGVAIALVHRVGGERVAAVAFVRPDAPAPPRVVDLGATLGDATPPHVIAHAGRILAAYHGMSPGVPAQPKAAGGRGGAERVLIVESVTPDGPSPGFLFEEGRDDSLASDIALLGDPADHGLAVWDEATTEPRGVIRGGPFAAGRRSGPPVDLSPKDSDAEMPRVVAFGKGFAVLWIAHAPDPDAVPAEASDFEVAGEPRARGWVEMVPVDETGSPTGASRRLTPPAGHVTAFDLRAASTTAILVVARDDGEAVDGSGGTLLRVRVGPDAAEPPVAFTTDSLGRGAPSFVEGAATWLAWVGASEQLRLLALDAAGTPSGIPSAEDAMEEARPVLALPSGHLLVESPDDATLQLRTFACGP